MPIKRVSAVLASLVLAAGPASAAPQMVTPSGAIGGVQEGGLDVYRGVPFARPPIGALRWAEPQPVKPWRGVRPAKVFAPACMQSGVSMPGETPPRVSEDCLYLNIWSPRRLLHAPLPVIVWIYGGGFFNGSASMPLYWGDQLAKKGAVVVTVGYRVGPFGFLAHPELTKSSPHQASGDYGFLDQIAALKWVRDNISKVGGDPGRVTIAGQSAGAASVSVLMASPLAKGLFQRAISQSGGMFEPLALAPDYQLGEAEREGAAYGAGLGAPTLAALRALPAGALLKGDAGKISHPVLDHYVLTASPYDVFARGEQSDVPLLVGSNADEARSLIPDLDAVKASSFGADIRKRWGPFPDVFLASYPHDIDAEAKRGRLDFERDLRFGWDTWAFARLQALRGTKPVYVYHFTEVPPFPKGSPYADWGPSHFAELWYVFDHLDQEPWSWRPEDRRLADALSSYWVEFAARGNPNVDSLPPWPAFTKTSETVLYLGDPVHPGPVADLNTLGGFDALYAKLRGVPFASPPGP